MADVVTNRATFGFSGRLRGARPASPKLTAPRSWFASFERMPEAVAVLSSGVAAIARDGLYAVRVEVAWEFDCAASDEDLERAHLVAGVNYSTVQAVSAPAASLPAAVVRFGSPLGPVLGDGPLTLLRGERIEPWVQQIGVPGESRIRGFLAVVAVEGNTKSRLSRRQPDEERE